MGRNPKRKSEHNIGKGLALNMNGRSIYSDHTSTHAQGADPRVCGG